MTGPQPSSGQISGDAHLEEVMCCVDAVLIDAQLACYLKFLLNFIFYLLFLQITQLLTIFNFEWFYKKPA